MAAQTLFHGGFELLGLVGHHDFGVLKGDAHRIIAACPRVVQGGLVAAQVHLYVMLGAIFPKVNHIALVGEGSGDLLGTRLVHLLKQFVEILVNLIHPTLVVALLRGRRVDFGGDGDHTGDVAGLGLCARHAAQTSGHKEFSADFAANLTAGVQHRNSGAVHDALWSDVHVRTGGHLSVLAHTQCVHALPVIRFGVVGNHHAVGDHHARGVLVRREQTQRMAGVHHQRLLVGHLRQVLHNQAVLRPVLEHGAVAAVGDQLVRVLRHRRIQVVLDHQHDGGRLATLRRIGVDGAGVHLVVRTIPVHVDAAVVVQLFHEFGNQLRMQRRIEVAERIAKGKLFLLFR